MKERKFGALISYISIIISTIISLLLTPYLLKSLGTSEHGLYSLVNSIVAYFTLMDFGFGNAIIRYSAKFIEQKDKDAEGKLLGMFLIIYSLLAIIIIILGITLAFNVKYIFSRNFTIEELITIKYLIIIGTINIAISFPLRIFNSSIQAHQKYIFFKVSQLFKHILNPLSFLTILFLGYKSIGLMIGAFIINIIFSIVEIIYYYTKIKVKIKLTLKNIGLLKEIIIYSFWIFLNLIVDKINWSTDQLILGIWAGTKAVSIYAIGSKINTYYMSLSTAISGVFLPEVTRMCERNTNDDEFSNLFIKIGRIQFLIIALILSGFILYGKSFINFWAGKNYNISYYVAIILITSLTIPSIQNIGITILQAKNLHKFRSLAYVINSIFNLIISIPLTIKFGPIGAAIGTAISLVIGSIVIINIYYYKKLHIDIIKFWTNIIKMSIGLIIPIVVGIITKKYLIINNWKMLLLNIFIYSIVYGISMWFISTNKYEKNLVLSPIKKILKKV